jgi:PQQ-like domain
MQKAKNNLTFVVAPLIATLLLTGCAKKKSELVWNQDFFIIGSQSSPRATDLNSDGVMDIVMGAGKNEYQDCDQGIIALDGKSGQLLWQEKSIDQVYGSATFYDVTGDGVSDVFIGGRSPNFKALNGTNGNVIWEYHYQYQNDSILKHARFNFNNSILVPDQNNDGLMDLVTVNGGNSKAAPNTEKGRVPGVLILFDSKTGTILAADTMPDSKESYMSPVGFENPGTKEYQLIFGSGGETVDGHLYLATLRNLMDQNLSQANIIASEKGHGFIAPPSLADINNDDYYDVVAISHASSVFAIDGKTKEIIWQQKVPDTESSNSFAVGQFTGDDTPDFFTFVSVGEWPNNTGTIQILFDGKDGLVAYTNTLGCTGFSSPVVYDMNGDGLDEAIISINEFDCSKGFVAETIGTVQNKLISINFKSKFVSIIDEAPAFKNIFSTPWLGDLDNDGYLDIVHCQYFSRGGLLAFLGMRVRRISTPVKVDEQPLWGSYMGTRGDGVFRRE